MSFTLLTDVSHKETTDIGNLYKLNEIIVNASMCFGATELKNHVVLAS